MRKRKVIESNAFLPVGQFLATKRVAAGLTQGQVALKLGYTRSQFISNIERGQASVPRRSIKKVLKLYKIKPDEYIEVVLEEQRKDMEKLLK